MTKHRLPKTLRELEENEAESEREFVLRVIAPRFQRGDSLRAISKDVGGSYETIRQLLIRYGVTKE